ncbi:tyrosyl-DNA phosphodiesterase 1 isoform X2 [Lolium perenne]|uniref:tyrosyl-DNA phosphodiesterase 1 isoform X2 n=1 Tax=Lolium perenne TaxID=4522 RepID=UPI003A994C1F
MASSHRVRVGTLVPFAQGKSGPSNASLLSIPIFEGSNVVGRSNLVVVDKRVSRKHLSLRAFADGSVEVVVEGPNPIVVRSEGQARKVCAQGRAKIVYDDVLELIPGDYIMKYVPMSDERKSSASVDSNDLKKGKRHSEEDSVVAKRNRQVMEDEALARTLQESFAEEGTSVPGMACGQALSSLDSAGSSERNSKRTHSAGPLKDVLPLTFRLMRVQGLPSWTNTSAVTIQDVIQGDVLFAVLSNYMVDIDWLLTACPSLRKVPHVLVLHGEDGASLEHLKWPEFRLNLPVAGDVNINAAFFRKFDYSSSTVRLIGSVPGYHVGPNMKRWGHMKLRSVLEECVFEKQFCKSPLIYQFSSLGSLDEKWMSEFACSLSAGKAEDGSPLGIGKPLIVWPTVEDVRCSIEGYAAGSCIPSPQKNVEKDFLRKYWSRWKADHVGRCRAMPHIKTFTRYNGQNIAWFLLTSSNLSKAAWGALQKNNTQLMIRSYELGVLFLPKTLQCVPQFSCTEKNRSNQDKLALGKNIKTKLVTLCWQGDEETDPSTTEVVKLPVPYQLPPRLYGAEDVPWSWDRRYTKKDVYGSGWPRHG